MNCFMRPYIQIGVAVLGAAVTFMPATAGAQATRISQIIEQPSPLLLHSSAQGYLGVLVGEVDNDSANKLKLKEVRGAVVTLIDHDAPAAQVGLRVNDVLLELNGQRIESAEAFGRMMREIPAGRKITILISRDGATQTLTVELADRKKMETDVWNKLNNGSDISTPVTGLGILGKGVSGDAPLPGGFHMPFVGNSTLKVGAVVEPLTSQMADYLGVANGLMVKQVGRKSEAAAAGMKAFDVILKVGTESIATVSDWERAMRSNQGKSVPVTVLRDKKQQVLTLQVDSKKKGEVEFHGLLPDGPCPLIAFANTDPFRDLMQHLEQSDIQSMRNQAEALQDQVQQWKSGNEFFGLSPEQAEELRRQSEQFGQAFKDKDFPFDQKQMEEFQKGMREFSKNFNSEQFGLDSNQMKEFQQQMQEWQKTFDPKVFQFDQKQMDELKRQMQEWQKTFPPQFE